MTMKKHLTAVWVALAFSWLCSAVPATAQVDPVARGLGAGAYALATTKTFATAAAARAANLAGVNGISTLAYATAGDGGQASYIKATDTQTFTCDIVSADSIRFHPISDVDPRICGATPDLVTVANVDMTGSTINVHTSTINTYGWPGFVNAAAPVGDVGKHFAIGGAGPAVAATGIIRVTSNPAANETCTVNGQVETAKSSGATTHQFNIVSSGHNETATNLAAAITADTATTGATAVAVLNEVRITANATGTSGNAITLTCASGDATAPKVEALQNHLAGGAATSELTGTITAVTSNHIATSSVAASTTVSSSYLDLGTDNTTALANALALTGGLDATATLPFYTAGYPWARGGQGSSANGPRRVVMRCFGRPNCVYGVLSELTLTTGAVLDFQEGAAIAALPGFSGDALIGMAQDSSTYHTRVSNLYLDGRRRVANGVWIRSCSYCEFTGRTYIQGAERIPIHLGTSEALGHSDRVIVTHFDHIYVAGQIGGNFAPMTNNPAGYAFFEDDNAGDTTVDVMEGQCYRTGYLNVGSATSVGIGHWWTTQDCGPMNTGFDFRSDSDHFNLAYADSPSNDYDVNGDNTSVSSVGAIVRGRTMVDQFQCYLNTGAAILNNDTNCISVTYQGGKGGMVWGDVRLSTTSSSYKYAAGVSYALADAISVSDGLKARQNFNVRKVGLPASTALTTGYTSQDQLAEGPTRVIGNTQYYPFPGPTTLTSGTALTSGNLYLWLSCLSRPTQIGRLSARVSTNDATPGNFQFYIYAADTTTSGYPATGTPILQSGSISEGTATVINYDPSPQIVLQQGCYWVGGQQDASTAAFTSLSSSSIQQQVFIGAGSAGQMGSSSLTTGRSYSNTYGVAKDLSGVSWTDVTAATMPMVWFRPQ